MPLNNLTEWCLNFWERQRRKEPWYAVYILSKGLLHTYKVNQHLVLNLKQLVMWLQFVCYLTKPFVFAKLYDSGSPSLETRHVPWAAAELFWLPLCNEMQTLECTKIAFADIEGRGHDTNKLNSGYQKKHGMLRCVGHG